MRKRAFHFANFRWFCANIRGYSAPVVHRNSDLLTSIYVPSVEAPVFTIWLRPATSTVSARGDSEVVVDARCGKLLFARTAAAMWIIA